MSSWTTEGLDSFTKAHKTSGVCPFSHPVLLSRSLYAMLGTEALMSLVLQQLLQGRCLKSSRQWFPGYRTSVVLVLSAILEP